MLVQTEPLFTSSLGQITLREDDKMLTIFWCPAILIEMRQLPGEHSPIFCVSWDDVSSQIGHRGHGVVVAVVPSVDAVVPVFVVVIPVIVVVVIGVVVVVGVSGVVVVVVAGGVVASAVVVDSIV